MVNSKNIKKALLEAYENKLKMLSESDVVDKFGDVILSKDLKVRDKKSGYEYTVFRVVDGKKGKKTIVLRPPNAPRFDKSKKQNLDIYDNNFELQKNSNYLLVSQDDFEKNFEVN
jgi:hypothetical protein